MPKQMLFEGDEEEYEYLVSKLQELMEKVGKKAADIEYWMCSSKNFGWRRLDSDPEWQDKKLRNSRAMLALLPKDWSSIQVYADYRARHIKIYYFNHDNSTGSAHIICRPATLKELETIE